MTLPSAAHECWLQMEVLMKKFCGPAARLWMYTGFSEYWSEENDQGLVKQRKALKEYLRQLFHRDKSEGQTLDIFCDSNVKGSFRRHFIYNGKSIKENSDSKNSILANFLSPYKSSFQKPKPNDRHKQLYDANRLAQLYVNYFFMIKGGETSTNHKEASLQWHQKDWSFLGKRKYDYLQIVLQQLYTPEEAQKLLELPSREAFDAWIVKGFFEGCLSLVPAAPNDPRHPGFYLWEEDLLADVDDWGKVCPELRGCGVSPLRKKLYKALKYGYWPLTKAILDYKNTPLPDTLIPDDPANALAKYWHNRLKVIMGKEGEEKLYTSRFCGLQDRKELAAAYYLLVRRAQRIRHEINNIREKERKRNLNADARYRECVSHLLSPATDFQELEKYGINSIDYSEFLENQWIDPADARNPFLDALEQAQILTEKMQKIIRLKLKLNRMIREPWNRYEIYAESGGLSYNLHPGFTAEKGSKYGIGLRTVELSLLPSIGYKLFAFLGPVRIAAEAPVAAETAPPIIVQPGKAQPLAQAPSQTMRR